MTKKLHVIEVTDETKIKHVERQIEALIALDLGAEAVEDAVSGVIAGCWWLMSRLREELAKAERVVVPWRVSRGLAYGQCPGCNMLIKEMGAKYCFWCGARFDWDAVTP